MNRKAWSGAFIIGIGLGGCAGEAESASTTESAVTDERGTSRAVVDLAACGGDKTCQKSAVFRILAMSGTTATGDGSATPRPAIEHWARWFFRERGFTQGRLSIQAKGADTFEVEALLLTVSDPKEGFWVTPDGCFNCKPHAEGHAEQMRFTIRNNQIVEQHINILMIG